MFEIVNLRRTNVRRTCRVSIPIDDRPVDSMTTVLAVVNIFVLFEFRKSSVPRVYMRVAFFTFLRATYIN